MAETDYQPDEESAELARKLSSNTLGDLRKSRELRDEPESSHISLERHARQYEIAAPLRDVTVVLEEFAWQSELARYFDGRMPCVRIGDNDQEIVPLSLPLDWGFPRPRPSWRSLRRFLPFPPEYLFEAYRDSARSRAESEKISFEPMDSVFQRLEKSLADFLSYRIAAFRAWSWLLSGGSGPRRGGPTSGNIPPPPPSWSPDSGLPVEVWCTTSGLTIEFSHAYFIHFMNFGAPSFPVKNLLLAGRYVFQGKGPTYPSGTQRSQVFRIPPDYKAVTTYF